ncbi:MAG: hypothetical protein RR639_01680 [Hydrogenoanaerobacterium sp.]
MSTIKIKFTAKNPYMVVFFSMLKSFSITLAALLLSFLLGWALLKWSLPRQSEAIAKSASSVPVDEADSSYEYMLKDYNGRLAVFSVGAETPDMVFDVYIKNLPDFDRTELQSGIKAKDYTALVELIEDYTS